MFGSSMVETAIGMVFVFLTTSLAVTAANELLASVFRWRARDLERGIARMLGEVAAHGAEPLTKLVNAFKTHALLRSLVTANDGFPSYISSVTFAEITLDITKLGGQARASVDVIRAAVEGSKLVPEHLKEVFGVLLTEVESDTREGVSDMAKFKQGVEAWFNEAMQRVAGSYKRRAQYTSLAFAMALALSINLDSVEMARTLSRDTALRQGLVAQATELVRRGQVAGEAPDASTNPYQHLAEDLRGVSDLGLPLGWARQSAIITTKSGLDALLFWLSKAVGLVLTALAASLGAPFWFDVLSRFVAIRSAGSPPAADKKGARA